jgi:hypothetical protein
LTVMSLIIAVSNASISMCCQMPCVGNDGPFGMINWKVMVNWKLWLIEKWFSINITLIVIPNPN